MLTKAFGLSLAVSILLLFSISANAQRIDIEATNQRYQRLYANGNFGAALVEARKLEPAHARLPQLESRLGKAEK